MAARSPFAKVTNPNSRNPASNLPDNLSTTSSSPYMSLPLGRASPLGTRSIPSNSGYQAGEETIESKEEWPPAAPHPRLVAVNELFRIPCREHATNFLREGLRLLLDQDEKSSNEPLLAQDRIATSLLSVAHQFKDHLQHERLLDASLTVVVDEMVTFIRDRQWAEARSRFATISLRFDRINVSFLLQEINKSKQAGSMIKGKSVLLLLGQTGSGKSTFTHVMAGSKMRLRAGCPEPDPDAPLPNPQLAQVRVAISADSITSHITPIRTSFTDMGADADNDDLEEFLQPDIYIGDAAGIFDTKGVEVEICNAYAMTAALRQAASVQIIFFVHSHTTGSRLELLARQVNVLLQMIDKVHNYIAGFYFIFNKWQQNDLESLSMLVEQLIANNAKSDQATQPEAKAYGKILNIMKSGIKAARASPYWRTPGPNLAFYDPMDPLQRSQIATHLLALHPKRIKNPLTTMRSFLSEGAAQDLSVQINKMGQAVSSALQIEDYPLVSFRLDLLKRMVTELDLPDVQAQYEAVCQNVRVAFDKNCQARQDLLRRMLDAASIVMEDDLRSLITAVEQEKACARIRQAHLGDSSNASVLGELNAQVKIMLTQFDKPVDSSTASKLAATYSKLVLLQQHLAGYLSGECAQPADIARFKLRELMFQLVSACRAMLEGDSAFDLYSADAAYQAASSVFDAFHDQNIEDVTNLNQQDAAVEVLRARQSQVEAKFGLWVHSVVSPHISSHLRNRKAEITTDIERVVKDYENAKKLLAARRISLFSRQSLLEFCSQVEQTVKNQMDTIESNLRQILASKSTANTRRFEAAETRFFCLLALKKLPGGEQSDRPGLAEVQIFQRVSEMKVELREILRVLKSAAEPRVDLHFFDIEFNEQSDTVPSLISQVNLEDLRSIMQDLTDASWVAEFFHEDYTSLVKETQDSVAKLLEVIEQELSRLSLGIDNLSEMRLAKMRLADLEGLAPALNNDNDVVRLITAYNNKVRPVLHRLVNINTAGGRDVSIAEAEKRQIECDLKEYHVLTTRADILQSFGVAQVSELRLMIDDRNREIEEKRRQRAAVQQMIDTNLPVQVLPASIDADITELEQKVVDLRKALQEYDEQSTRPTESQSQKRFLADKGYGSLEALSSRVRQLQHEIQELTQQDARPMFERLDINRVSLACSYITHVYSSKRYHALSVIPDLKAAHSAIVISLAQYRDSVVEEMIKLFNEATQTETPCAEETRVHHATQLASRLRRFDYLASETKQPIIQKVFRESYRLPLSSKDEMAPSNCNGADFLRRERFPTHIKTLTEQLEKWQRTGGANVATVKQIAEIAHAMKRCDTEYVSVLEQCQGLLQNLGMNAEANLRPLIEQKNFTEVAYVLTQVKANPTLSQKFVQAVAAVHEKIHDIKEILDAAHETLSSAAQENTTMRNGTSRIVEAFAVAHSIKQHLADFLSSADLASLERTTRAALDSVFQVIDSKINDVTDCLESHQLATIPGQIAILEMFFIRWPRSGESVPLLEDLRGRFTAASDRFKSIHQFYSNKAHSVDFKDFTSSPFTPSKLFSIIQAAPKEIRFTTLLEALNVHYVTAFRSMVNDALALPEIDARRDQLTRLQRGIRFYPPSLVQDLESTVAEALQAVELAIQQVKQRVTDALRSGRAEDVKATCQQYTGNDPLACDIRRELLGELKSIFIATEKDLNDHLLNSRTSQATVVLEKLVNYHNCLQDLLPAVVDMYQQILTGFFQRFEGDVSFLSSEFIIQTTPGPHDDETKDIHSEAAQSIRFISTSLCVFIHIAPDVVLPSLGKLAAVQTAISDFWSFYVERVVKNLESLTFHQVLSVLRLRKQYNSSTAELLHYLHSASNVIASLRNNEFTTGFTRLGEVMASVSQLGSTTLAALVQAESFLDTFDLNDPAFRRSAEFKNQQFTRVANSLFFIRAAMNAARLHDLLPELALSDPKGDLPSRFARVETGIRNSCMTSLNMVSNIFDQFRLTDHTTEDHISFKQVNASAANCEQLNTLLTGLFAFRDIVDRTLIGVHSQIQACGGTFQRVTQVITTAATSNPKNFLQIAASLADLSNLSLQLPFFANVSNAAVEEVISKFKAANPSPEAAVSLATHMCRFSACQPLLSSHQLFVSWARKLFRERTDTQNIEWVLAHLGGTDLTPSAENNPIQTLKTLFTQFREEYETQVARHLPEKQGAADRSWDGVKMTAAIRQLADSIPASSQSARIAAPRPIDGLVYVKTPRSRHPLRSSVAIACGCSEGTLVYAVKRCAEAHAEECNLALWPDKIEDYLNSLKTDDGRVFQGEIFLLSLALRRQILVLNWNGCIKVDTATKLSDETILASGTTKAKWSQSVAFVCFDDKLRATYDAFRIDFGWVDTILNFVNVGASKGPAVLAKLLKEQEERIEQDEADESLEWLDPDSYAQLPMLLGRLFAYWTVVNSSKDEVYVSSGAGLSQYLLQPHPVQVIAIFRLLGIGASHLSNNIVQVLTGEGKSVVLAMTAIVLALLGAEVSCACYSRHLSIRDHKNFSQVFSALGVSDRIYYGTFESLSERFINRNGPVRDRIRSVIEENKIVVREGVDALRRPRVLLIDEVDVFFGNDFASSVYTPAAVLKSSEITALATAVWEANRDLNPLPPAEGRAKMDYALDACTAAFPGWEPLIKGAFAQMLADVKSITPPYYVYNKEKDQIGYKHQDGVVFNKSEGYKTLFAYFKERDLGRITDGSLANYIALDVRCGYFSYAQIPSMFHYVMGVSGTLDSLFEEESKMIASQYGMSTRTFCPSAYGTSKLLWTEAKKLSGSLQIYPNEHFYSEIVKEIERRLVSVDNANGAKRAVLVFFASKVELGAFEHYCKDKAALLGGFNIITEEMAGTDIDRFVSLASISGHVTLMTREFGRGTDFVCRDQMVSNNGGVHVIQTFLSEHPSEEKQIQGRTARQGQRGTYSMVLNYAHLQKYFPIPPGAVVSAEQAMEDEIKQFHANNKDGKECVYDLLDRKRRLLFEIEQKSRNAEAEIHANSHAHSLCLLAALDSGDTEFVRRFIQDNNGEQQGSVASRTLVLMDATGSMATLLHKSKEKLGQVFTRARETLEVNCLDPKTFALQIGVYRNYNCDEDTILQSSGWENDPVKLISFLNTVTPQGGLGNEAIEVGFFHVNQELAAGRQVSQVILIGDAPPNTPEEIKTKRAGTRHQEIAGAEYWRRSRFGKVGHYREELRSVLERKIPVHTFYVSKNAEDGFKRIAAEAKAVNDKSRCVFLDVNDEKHGADDLANIVLEEILRNVGGVRGDELVADARKRYKSSYRSE